MAKKISILFIRNATAELKRQASEYGYVIRDPAAYVEGEFVEPCDIVSGEAPAAYKQTAEYVDQSELDWLKPPTEEQPKKPSRKAK